MAYFTKLRFGAMKNPFPLVLVMLLGVLAGTALTGCGGSKPKVDVTAMTQALKNNDPEAKANALAEIAKAGPGAAPAISSIMPLLKDQDALVRRLAAYALGEIGPAAKSSLPDLRGLLNDPDRFVVSAAMNAIKGIDPAAASAPSVPNVTR